MAAYRRNDLKFICGLTACTPGSALGPTLGNEYGRTLPLPKCGSEDDRLQEINQFNTIEMIKTQTDWLTVNSDRLNCQTCVVDRLIVWFASDPNNTTHMLITPIRSNYWSDRISEHARLTNWDVYTVFHKKEHLFSTIILAFLGRLL